MACIFVPLALSGCLAAAVPPAADLDCDGVPDARDAWVGTCARANPIVAPTYRVAFALVTPRGALVSPETLASLTAMRADLMQVFDTATGSRAHMIASGAPIALPLTVGAPSMEDAPASLAAAYFATGAPAAEFLVLVADGVHVASPACACVSWHEKARAPERWGAPADFLGVTALGSVSDMPRASEMQYRFLHETAHAWCCDAVPALDPIAYGGHWRALLGDPISGDGTSGRPATLPAYADATLVAMGALAPQDARPVTLPDGRLLSGFDIKRGLEAAR